jgi:hypothetical protein
MRLIRAPIAGLIVAVALVAPAPAAALPPGVYATPGSPAGKEYAFPLGSQRGQAVGHVSPSGTDEPLFGVGISPPAASAHGARSRVPVLSSAAARRDQALRLRRASSALGASRLALASLERPRSTTSQIALITAAVLLGAVALGGALELVRRRRHG